MTLGMLLAGLAVGALAAFPLGPVGVMCVQRALTRGARSGIASASGIALASALWCLAAVQGLGLLARHLPLNANAFRLALGLLLLGLAARNALRPPDSSAPDTAGRSLAGPFLLTLLVVLANPLTLITVVAILAAFNLQAMPLTPAAACGFALAVFAGGLGLWLALGWMISLLRGRLADRGAARVARCLNAGAAALGAAYVLSALWTACRG